MGQQTLYEQLKVQRRWYGQKTGHVPRPKSD